MKTYIEALNEIIESTSDENTLARLRRIEEYVRGEISPKELMYGADDSMRELVYSTINRILNYRSAKEKRYYIEAPIDKDFNISHAPSIICGRLDSLGTLFNSVCILGPSEIGESCVKMDEESLFEIEGDFSKCPEGVMINRSDWYRIILRHPKLLRRMVTLTRQAREGNSYVSILSNSVDSVAKRVEEHISSHLDRKKDRELVGYLDDEFIESLSFVIPIEYISRREIEWRDFGPFEELIVAHGKDPEKDFKIESGINEIHMGESQIDYSEDSGFKM